jgi:queuine tRNA-ribosyltransferase
MSKIFEGRTLLKNARAGELKTSHGVALTPMFMPVGTRATIKSVDSEDITAIHPQVILANTYHLYLRPGHEHVAQMGGVHEFMRYRGPMLTDSGGFQVFSLGAQLDEAGQKALKPSTITENGVEFTSYLDGSRHMFTPEKSIEIQQHLGADIIMAFDECVPDAADQAYTRPSVERTTRWLHRCVAQWDAMDRQSVQGHHQSLFGIVQGAQFPELRRSALEDILKTPVEGIAFGGETVGYNMAVTVEILNWVRDLLPDDMPRYAMGLGRDPQNVIDAVQAGFDMFDCVAPTRLARNGTLYFGELDMSEEKWLWQSPYKNGRLQIGNAAFRSDTEVIQPGCDCHTCTSGYTRAYLHYLFRAGELSYYRLASLHNLRTMVRLTEHLRTRILKGC